MEDKKKKADKFEPFKALFLARSNYGKSYLASDYIIDLFKKKHIEPKRMIVFSKTYKSDDSQRRFIEYAKKEYPQFEDKNCYAEIDTEVIDKLYKGCKKIKESGGK
jgi:hypothetical protein